MKFACPQCGQPLETQTMYKGQTVACPKCGTSMVIPASGWQGQGSDGAPGSGTLPQEEAGGTSISNILTSEPAKKYEVGETVAQGGMGAILNARDVNLRRSVAMKVILDPKTASEDQLLRFVEEAQITGQLEHPGIVPLHELGLDTSGNVFYTMKFVKGRTLSDILEKIHDGDTETIREYPLAHLLTIFQKVCDAIAFAHSKRVIHRDLKPENVMVGDYGEVLVMDWGLAKVLPRKKSKTFARDEGGRMRLEKGGRQELQVSGLSPQPSPVIDSVRKDSGTEVLKTMDGAIMGTPGFMSPEQAMGDLEEIDTRTDIYALGAILYNILTLRPPVTGKTLAEILDKVTKGEIRKPTEYNDKRSQKPESRSQSKKTDESRVTNHVSLAHLPDQRVPESLSAVAMRALELKTHRRYQTVKELQKEIDAYQGGFATKAEDAGAWKQFMLFVKRNQAVAGLVALIILLLVLGSVVSTMQWIKANRLKKEAVAEKELAKKNYLALKGTAPALAAQAQIYFQNLALDKALDTINYACSLVPENIEYFIARGNILQTMIRLAEAEQAYREALRINPANKMALQNAELCRKLQAELKGKKETPFTTVTSLYLAMKDQNRFDDVLVMLRAAGKYNRELENFMKAILAAAQIKPDNLSMDGNGLCHLNLDGSPISDLSPLRGIPLVELNIARTRVTDLSPLRGMPLKTLELIDSGVSDLAPLKGMPLEKLKLHAVNIKDISPLARMPLKNLQLQWSRNISDISVLRGMQINYLDITGLYCHDLSPLAGMPLKLLGLAYTEITDLTPLKGMPLKDLWLNHSKVTDLTPVKDLPLEFLDVTVSPVSDISPLAGHKTLQQLWLSETRVADIRPVESMSLKVITLRDTPVTDVTPLSQCRTLECILLPAGAKGIETLRKLPNLKRISFRDPLRIDGGQSAPDFWKEFDAGKTK